MGRIRTPFERLVPFLVWSGSKGGSVEVLGKLAAAGADVSSNDVG